MCKRYIRRILALIVVIIVIIHPLKVKCDELNKVLILYDSDKEYGEDGGNLNLLIRASLATNNEVRIKKISKYEKGECDYYKGVIILSNLENLVNNKAIEDVFSYKGKCIFIGRNNEMIIQKLQKEFNRPIKILASDEYNGLSIKEFGNISFIEEISNKNLVYFIFRNYVLKSFGNDKNYSRNYLMIDKVYAIANLSELMDKIDYLYDEGIRAIFSIMPVYENANLYAMRNYTEVLRYAQSRNVRMFFHSADVYREDTSVKDIYERMKLGYSNYINYHVYPVAVDIPENWLYFEDYKMIFNKSNTIALTEGKKVDTTYLEDYTLKPVVNFFEKVDLTSIKSIDEKLINQNLIFTIPNNLKFEEFKKVVSIIKDKNIRISDPKYLNMTMEFDERNILTNDFNGIYLNKTMMDLKGNVSQNEIKDKVTKEADNNGLSLKKANTVIIVITVGASLLFVIIAFISRRIDRRKYFK